MKSRNSVFAISIATYVLFFLNSCFTLKYPQKSIAIVTSEFIAGVHGNSGYDVEYYTKDGKKIRQYKGLPGVYPKVFIGEKFKMVYDSSDYLGNWNIYLSKPLFLKSEITQTSTGLVTEIEQYKNHFDIDFEYRSINGRLYRKTQVFMGQNDTNMKVGDKFNVEYLIDNPQRAILLIDSLVTDTINGVIVRVAK